MQLPLRPLLLLSLPLLVAACHEKPIDDKSGKLETTYYFTR